MISLASAFLGAVFLLSESGLARWRRAASDGSGSDHDAGSLRFLWIVNSASITAGFILASFGMGPWLPTSFSWPWIGVAVFGVGMVLRWWSIWHLGRFFTVNVSVANDHRVIDTGPYRFVRHPSYSGILLQYAGLGLSFGLWPSLLVAVVPPTLAILYRIRLEESALNTHLGAAYAAYSARTKKIVPLVF